MKIFKSPTAGELLEKAGCKGMQVGGAEISMKHANWIINKGNATQQDILILAAMAKEMVWLKFGVKLEPEITAIDEYGNKIDI